MELTRLLFHSSHKCVESYGPQHRMCLFRRVCRRDDIPTENDKGHRTFDYYLCQKPSLTSVFLPDERNHEGLWKNLGREFEI